MSWVGLLAAMGGVLGVVQVVPYLASIKAGRTRPARASYGIWALVGAVSAASYIAAGARWPAVLLVVFAVTGALIFCWSLLPGVGAGGTSALDIGCLLVAVAGVAGWVGSGDPVVALYMSAAVTGVGYLPTLVKLARRPGSENVTSWLLSTAACTLTMLILPNTALRVVIAPGVSWVGHCAVLAIAGWHALARRQAISTTPTAPMPGERLVAVYAGTSEAMVTEGPGTWLYRDLDAHLDALRENEHAAAGVAAVLDTIDRGRGAREIAVLTGQAEVAG